MWSPLTHCRSLCAETGSVCRAHFYSKRTAPLPAPAGHCRIAARFAVKEAVAKALGTGIGQVGWQDIETTNRPDGAPVVTLHGSAQELAAAKGVKTVHCSISHERSVAVAMIILEG